VNGIDSPDAHRSAHSCEPSRPASSFVGDSHEVEPLSLVRSTDARRCKICRPAGVTLFFQVSENSVEPPESIRARNLLSKHDWRAALADETEPLGPQVPLVLKAAR
jgi:hypothetical protein